MKQSIITGVAGGLFCLLLMAAAPGPSGAVDVFQNGYSSATLDFYVINNTPWSVSCSANSDWNHKSPGYVPPGGSWGDPGVSVSCNDSEGGHLHIGINSPNYCEAMISVDHMYDAGCHWVAWNLSNESGFPSGMTGGGLVEQVWNQYVVVSLMIARGDDKTSKSSQLDNSKVLLVINVNIPNQHGITDGDPW